MLSAYFFPFPRSDSFSSLRSAIHPFVVVSIDPAILAARAASRMVGEGAVIAHLPDSTRLDPAESRLDCVPFVDRDHRQFFGRPFGCVGD